MIRLKSATILPLPFMDPALLPYAKEKIRRFRKNLCAELEDAGNPKAVYTLSVQLFPMSHVEEENKDNADD